MLPPALTTADLAKWAAAVIKATPTSSTTMSAGGKSARRVSSRQSAQVSRRYAGNVRQETAARMKPDYAPI